MKKKRKVKSSVLVIFVAICFIGLVYYGYKIVNWKLSLKTNKKIQEEITEKIRVIEFEDENHEDEYDVDFDALKEQNSDTVAYLRVKNTVINYVVVRGLDNSYYLNHNFNKNYNAAGWVFADYHNKFDGSDKNIVIYGHSMKDGSMFGSLGEVLDSSWYLDEGNQKIALTIGEKTYYYQVFSIYTIEEEDYYINTEFYSNEEFMTFTDTLKDRSIHDFNIDFDTSDKILTLSTCLNIGSKRIVLHAKLIK